MLSLLHGSCAHSAVWSEPARQHSMCLLAFPAPCHMYACRPALRAKLPPPSKPWSHSQDIIQRWHTLPAAAQQAVFNAALITTTSADASWARLEWQLQLALDVAGT